MLFCLLLFLLNCTTFEVPWDHQMCLHYLHPWSSINHPSVAGFGHKSDWDYFSNLNTFFVVFYYFDVLLIFLLFLLLCIHYIASTTFCVPCKFLPPWLLTTVVEGRDCPKEFLLISLYPLKSTIGTEKFCITS